MKVKKIFFFIMTFVSLYLKAEMIRHTMVSITEQKMLGHMFKHVITSGSADKDEFFIDGYAVLKENYYKEFERIQKKEWEEIAAHQENQRRSRVQFSEMIQMEVTAKLLDKVVMQSVEMLKKICNPALEKFYQFTGTTIDSIEQLHQLQAFVDQIQSAMKKRIENKDADGLHVLYVKIEPWPARLEKFFQDTVQQAIYKSDDTAMLKELLSLASQPF